jgi:histidinol dehydrogenase
VYDFLKKTSIVRYTEAELKRTAHMIDRIARAEGLDAHARSAILRIED